MSSTSVDVDMVTSFVEEVLNRHDTSLVPQLFCQRYVDNDPFYFHAGKSQNQNRKRKHGIPDLIEFISFLEGPQVDAKFTLEDCFQADDRIAYRLYGEATVRLVSITAAPGRSPSGLRVFSQIISDATEGTQDEPQQCLHLIYDCTGIFELQDHRFVARWGMPCLR